MSDGSPGMSLRTSVRSKYIVAAAGGSAGEPITENGKVQVHPSLSGRWWWDYRHVVATPIVLQNSLPIGRRRLDSCISLTTVEMFNQPHHGE